MIARGGFSSPFRSSLRSSFRLAFAPAHEDSGESEIERLFREEAARTWPAEPALVAQYPVTAGGQGYRLDFALPALMLAVELDGHATHSSTVAIARDRMRQRNLEDAGWRIRRYGGAEVWADAGAVVLDAIRWAGLEPRAHDCDGPEVCESCYGSTQGYWRWVPYEIVPAAVGEDCELTALRRGTWCDPTGGMRVRDYGGDWYAACGECATLHPDVEGLACVNGGALDRASGVRSTTRYYLLTRGDA